MNIVNQNYLDVFLDPLTGLADDDDSVIQYSELEVNNEEKVKIIISEMLKPYFFGFDEDSQEKLKLSLSYYLTKSSIDFGRLFDSVLPPFDPPDEAKNFFIWIWEIFFPKEDYHLIDVDNYIEVNDIGATMKLKHVTDKRQ